MRNSVQNNHLCNINNQSLTLWRFPKQEISSSLQAWDSADALLVERFITEFNLTESVRVVTLNDNFGMITLALNAYQPQFFNDSHISHLALAANAQTNNIAPINNTVYALQDINEADVYLLKIPKNLDFLEAQLAYLHAHGPADLTLIAAAKATDINKSVVKLFNRYFKNVDVSLAHKKSRTISALNKQKSPYSSYQYWKNWQTSDNTAIYNAPNVFSRSQLDQGAAFLMANLPDCNGKNVIDLACGNGVISTAIAQQKPANIILVDESYMAIESAKKNLLNDTISAKSEFYLNDCLTGFADNSADIIVCNPPFHQQKAITTHIAMQMFSDAKRVLKNGGELRIVGNAHLGYKNQLQSIFGDVNFINQNDKFVILSTIK
ncbi:methyltransferase [Catenovulum sediminis]|uniref:methyltransferase n=1 Tax=Catenovulum sediminis TaxID=1740262 RepID=UPI0033160566